VSAHDNFRQYAGVVAIQSAALKSFEQNRTIIEIVAKAQESNRRAVANIVKGSAGLSEQTRLALEQIKGSYGLSEQTRKALLGIKASGAVSEHVRRSLDAIIARPAYAEMVGVNKTLSQIVSQRVSASMIGTATVPRAAFAGVFESIREPIGADLYADAVATFELAEDQAGEGDGETWWLARADPVVLLGLVIVLLQSLDAIGQAVANLAGQDVPSEYQEGAKILFAVVAVAYAFIVARASVQAKD
jgi:hypothetical protein